MRYINFIEWFGIVLMVFSLPLFESPKNVGFLIALLGFLWKRFYTWNLSFKFHYFGLGLTIFFIASLIASFFAEDLKLSLKGSWDIFRYTMVFLIIANDVKDLKKVKILIWLILISITIGSVWGIMEVFPRPKNEPYPLLEIHSVGHANHSGIYLAEVLSLIMALLLFSTFKGYEKAVIASAGIISIIALILTTSYGSFIGLGAVIIAFLVILRNKLAISLVLIFLVGFISFLLIDDVLKTRLFDVIYRSGPGRLVLWKDSFIAFLENPVVGVGLNHFAMINREDIAAPHAHNLYFNVLVEMGGIGLLALIILIIGFFKTWRQNKPPTESGLEKGLWYASLGSVLVVLIGGIPNTTLHHEHAMLFTLITGIMVASSHREDQE